MNNKKHFLILFLLILLAFFLRAYRINHSFSFSGEFGDNLLDIKNAIVLKEVPLLGPPTSHPWLSFGPLYFWVMIPLMLVFEFEPIVGVWFGVFIGIFTIFINYLVLKKFINIKAALLSSFLIAISPLWILFARDARFFFIVTSVFYLFLYCLWNVYKNNKNYFWLGISYSLFFHFHFSPALLFPVMLFFLFKKRKNIKKINYLHLFLGLLVVQTPLFIHEFKNGFSMIYKFLLWVPYRVAGFLGLYPKNNFSIDTLKQSIHVLVEFIGKSFFFERSIWPYITILFLVIFLYSFYKYLTLKKFTFIETFLYISFFVSLLGIITHGDIPVHYFLPVFSVPIIFVSIKLCGLFEKHKNRFFVKGVFCGFLIFVFTINTKHFINYYSGFNNKTFTLQPNFVSLDLQKEIAKYIVNDSNGQKYSLKRIGPDDHFEECYSQNYKYLLWLYGNEPVEDSDLIYTIYEEFDTNITNISDFTFFEGIGVLKN